MDDPDAAQVFEVHVLVTDLQIDKTVRATGNMGIGQLILKVVEMIDMNIDWSDQAIWWPTANKWLLRPRGTLDQYGVSHDAKLWLTRMHRALRVQLPDLRVVTDRIDFSRNVFSEVLAFCKRLGIRHAEELSFARKARVRASRRRSGSRPGEADKEQVPPADVGLTRSPYMPTSDFGATPADNVQPTGNGERNSQIGGLGYLTTPTRESLEYRNSTILRSPGARSSNSQTLSRQNGNGNTLTLRSSYGSLPDGMSGESQNLSISEPVAALDALPTMVKARTIREKARLNIIWLDSSRSLMEQGVREGELLCLRFKYLAVFDLDRALDANRINQLYEQFKWSVLNEEVDCSENEMWMLAALQLQARLRSAVSEGAPSSPTSPSADDRGSVFGTLLRSQPNLLDDTMTLTLSRSGWNSQANLGGTLQSNANLTLPSSGAHSVSGDDPDYTELDHSPHPSAAQQPWFTHGNLLSGEQLRALDDEIEADLDALERQLELGQLEPVIQSGLPAAATLTRRRTARIGTDSLDASTSPATPATPATPLNTVKTSVPELNDYLGYVRARRTLGTLKSFKRVWFTLIDMRLSAFKRHETAATPQARPDAAWNLRGAEVHSECSVDSGRYIIKLHASPVVDFNANTNTVANANTPSSPSTVNPNGSTNGNVNGTNGDMTSTGKIEDAKAEEIWLKCESKEQYAKWFAAFRLTARAKTMASAAYECEVHTILAFLNLQKASVGGSRQPSVISLSQALGGNGAGTGSGGNTLQRPGGNNSSMQRQASNGTLLSSPATRSTAMLASTCVPEDFVAARFFKRFRPRQIVKRILNAHANVREMTALEAKLNYISAYQRLPDYGLSFFEARFTGPVLRNNAAVRREHLLAIAANRFMMVDAQSGATLKSWPFSMLKTWTTNYEARTVEFLIVPSASGRDEAVTCILDQHCDPKTVHEFIGGYLFLATRSMDRNQQLDEDLFHKMTGRPG